MIPPNSNPLTYPTPTQVASSSTTPPLLLAQANICIKTNRTFRERRDEVEQLKKRCTAASLEKGVVDGWSDEVKRGVSGWVDDIEVSWRCLRRAVWDQEKAFRMVMDSLDVILSNSLLTSLIPRTIYPPPSAQPPLFTILPYPAHTDPLDRPIAVLSLRSLRKEPTKEGKDRVKQWAWWCAEMTRRCLKEVDEVRRGRGEAGEEQRVTGCVMMVDFKNAGFKNIDLDIVPHLLAILQTTYPGLFSTIYLLNHSWTHASLWTVVKRLVPKSVLDRVRFLEKGDLEQVMQLDKIPQALGGKSGYDVAAHPEEAMDRYSHELIGHERSFRERESSDGPSSSSGGTRAARGKDDSPHEQQEEGGGRHEKLVGRKPSLGVIAPTPVSERSEESDVTDSEEESDAALQVDRMRGFELHLSPDRVKRPSFSSSSSSTKIADQTLSTTTTTTMISGSGSGSLHRFPSSSRSITGESPKIQMRVTGWPRLSFDSASERSYSASLQEHHSRRLSETRVAAEKIRAKELLLKELRADENGDGDDESTSGRRKKRFTIGPAVRSRSVDETVLQAARAEGTVRKTGLAISAYDRMKNPMFGYPAVCVSVAPAETVTIDPQGLDPSSTSGPHPGVMYASQPAQTIVPMYGRRRKRDLVKTLFLLGILRIVGLRDWFISFTGELGRLFWGLLYLRRWVSSMSGLEAHERGRSGMYARGRRDVPLTPTSGLNRQLELSTSKEATNPTVRRGNALVSQDDWMWLFLSLLVVRDGWGRIIVNAWESTRKGLRAVTGRSR